MTILDASVKPFHEVRAADESVLCYAKFNPFVTTDANGTVVTAATIQVEANDLLFTVNGSAETVIGTYTGNSGADNAVVFADGNIASIQNLINTINGLGVGHPTGTSFFRRWRAGYGDYRPQYVIGAGDATAAVATNALLGRGVAGLAVLADISGHASANLIAVGCGTDHAIEGNGQQFPDHFESDYVSDTSGNRYPIRSPRRVEEQPGLARTQVTITSIVIGAQFATAANVRVYDNANNLLQDWPMTAGAAAGTVPGSTFATGESPLVTGPPGSPLFVEFYGTGALTDGPVTVRGYTRVV